MSETNNVVVTVPLGAECTGLEMVEGGELSKLVHRTSDKIGRAPAEESAKFALDLLGAAMTRDDAGLGLGKVQSGKTLGFTNLIAAAHDTGKFQIIVVIGGAKLTLESQNQDRIKKDLAIAGRTSFYIYDAKQIESNPSIANDIAGKIKDGPRRKTVIFSCLKLMKRIDTVTAVIEKLNKKHTDLNVLIIDDECDSYSLNTNASSNRRNNEDNRSATYACIARLRVAAKSNYLGITATAQANFFTDILDEISPGFARTLAPGNSYFGLKDAFRDPNDFPCTVIRSEDNYREFRSRTGGAPPHQRFVDPAELGTFDSEGVIPQSLKRALAFYILAFTNKELLYDLDTDPWEEKCKCPRMMVHHDRAMAKHAAMEKVIRDIKSQWKNYLEKKSPTSAYESFVLLLRDAYDDLSGSLSQDEIGSFDDLLERIPDVLSDLEVKVANSHPDSGDINWVEEFGKHCPMIILGGDYLNRGFTIDDLCVSWFTRDSRSSQQDTVYQRARFLGHKSAYKSLIRIWTTRSLCEEFFDLIKVDDSIWDWVNLDHDDLRRDRIFAGNSNPTRKNVIADYPVRHAATQWVNQNFGRQKPEQATSANELVQQLIKSHQFQTANTTEWPWLNDVENLTESMTHTVCNDLTNSRALAFLEDYVKHLNSEDALQFQFKVINPLSRAISEGELGPSDKSALMQMGFENDARKRSIGVGLHQGSTNEPGVPIANRKYCGDSYVKGDGALTIQLHKIKVNTPPPGTADFPLYALSIHISRGVLKHATAMWTQEVPS